MCVGVCAGVDVDAGVGAGGTRSEGMGVDPAMLHGQHSETPGNGCSVPDGEDLVLEEERESFNTIYITFMHLALVI